MLKDHPSSAIVAVTDMARARAFYADTLGLDVEGGGMGADGPMIVRTGTTRLVVYPSESAGTNRANAVVWGVGDELEAIVAALTDKGVVFDRYDIPGATFRGGVHRAGDFLMAWFKDPDGNILHLNSAD